MGRGIRIVAFLIPVILLVGCSSGPGETVNKYIGHLNTLYGIMVREGYNTDVAAGKIFAYVEENRTAIEELMTAMQGFDVEATKRNYKHVEVVITKIDKFLKVDPRIYPDQFRQAMAKGVEDNQANIMAVVAQMNASEKSFLKAAFAEVAVTRQLLQDFAKSNPLKSFNLKNYKEFQEAVKIMGIDNRIL